MTVHATETGDGGLSHLLTYSIVSGNTNGAFSVDETSGVFTLAHSVDWETLSPNPIVVIVSLSTDIFSKKISYFPFSGQSQ